MGSLGTTSRAAVFQNQIFQKGIDLRRSKISNDDGTGQTTAAATIRAGQFAAYDADGFLVAANLTGVVGIFKWDKQTLGKSIRVDQAIVLTGTSAIALSRGSVSNVSVRSAANFTGTLYTVTTDYTVNATNGTVTRVALGAITAGQTVYVTFTYDLVAADFDVDGRTFRNNTNDMVTGQENRVTLITGWSSLYTMEWDSTVTYATSSSNFKLYCSAAGQATSTSTSAEFVGRVKQLPTADDPYLGMIAHGNPVV